MKTAEHENAIALDEIVHLRPFEKVVYAMYHKT